MDSNTTSSQPALGHKVAGAENRAQQVRDDAVHAVKESSPCTASEAALHRNRDRHASDDEDKRGEAPATIEGTGTSKPPAPNQGPEGLNKTKDPNLCLNYLKNMGCLKGASCLKTHSDEAREVQAQRRASTHCQFYLRGSCTRGDECDFWHDQAALEEIHQEKKPDQEKKPKDAPNKPQPSGKTIASTPIGSKTQCAKKVTGEIDTRAVAPVIADRPPGNFSPKANTPKVRSAPSLIPSATTKTVQEEPSASPCMPPEHAQRVNSESKEEPQHAAKKARLTAPSEYADNETSEFKVTCYGMQSTRVARLENKEANLQLYRCEKAVHFTVSPDKELTALFFMVCPNGHHMTQSRDEDPLICTGCKQRIKANDRFYFCVCGYIFGGKCSIRPFKLE